MIAYGIVPAGADTGSAFGWTEILISCVAAMSTIITGWFAYNAQVYSKGAKQHIEAIDKSVNGVPEGTPPLVDRVLHLERRVDSHGRWLEDSLHNIAVQLGAALPDRRDYDPDT